MLGCSLFYTERQIKYLGRMLRLKDHSNYIERFSYLSFKGL